MKIMQKIKTLKNKSGESFYPLTSTKAVVDENGNTIEDRLVVADGEDLVTDGNVLRLKDRPNTDGMGYVILRKGKTFQEQVTKPNTIYEIRYDFDLDGAEITIPENCVLKFEGGSLRGGILVGNGTTFRGLKDSCLTVDFAGTFICNHVKASYVGLYPSGDGTVDGTPNQMDGFLRLNNLIRGTETITVEFDYGYYGFGGGGIEAQNKANKPSKVWNGWYAICIQNINGISDRTKNLKLIGNGAKFINVYGYYIGGWKKDTNGALTPIDSTPGWEYNVYGGGFMFIHSDEMHMELDNVHVDMKEEETFRYGGRAPYSTNNCTLFISSINSYKITNSYFANSPYENLLSRGVKNSIYIGNTTFVNGRRHNIAFSSYDSCVLKNIKTINGGMPRVIEGSSFTFERSGHDIDFEGEEYGNYVFGDLLIDGHISIDPCRSVYISGPYVHRNISISNIKVFSTKWPTDYDDNFNIVEQEGFSRFSILYAYESFNVNNIYLENKSPSAGEMTIPNIITNYDNKEWLLDSSLASTYIDNAVVVIKHCPEGKVQKLYANNTQVYNYRWDGTRWEQIRFSSLKQFQSSGAKCYCIPTIFRNLTIHIPKNAAFATRIASAIDSMNIENLTIYNLHARTNSALVVDGSNYGSIKNLDIVDVSGSNELSKDIIGSSIGGLAENITISKTGMYYGFKVSNSINASMDCISYSESDSDGHVVNNVVFNKKKSSGEIRLPITNGGYSSVYLGVPHPNISDKIDCTNTFGLNPNIANGTHVSLQNKRNSAFQILKKTGNDSNGNIVYQTMYMGDIKVLPQSTYNSLNEIKTTPGLGESVYITHLNKPVWWNGTEWVEGDNRAAGIKRAGTWSQRPNADGSFLENGFQYFLLESEPDEDPEGNPMESITGNGKPIWWIQDSRKWVDALGNTITGGSDVVNKLLSEVNEVRHIINGEEYKFLTTEDESHSATIYAPTELENDGYVVVQQDNKAKFVDPADIGLK